VLVYTTTNNDDEAVTIHVASPQDSKIEDALLDHAQYTMEM